MKFKNGSALVEVLVSASILSIVTFSFLGVFTVLSRFHQKDMYSIKGGLLAEEGIEALRLMKSGGWNVLSSIPLSTDRYFALGTSTWSATTTPEVLDGIFYRKFKIYSVNRDVNEDITPSGGTLDSNTLFLESDVSWSWRGSTTTTTYKAYMTNI